MNKTLDEIKQEYARENGCKSWRGLTQYDLRQQDVDEVAKRYAHEIAKEALKNASKNVKLGISEYRTRKDGSIGWIVTETKNLFIINDGCNVCATQESILSESNIPEEARNE